MEIHSLGLEAESWGDAGVGDFMLLLISFFGFIVGYLAF